MPELRKMNLRDSKAQWEYVRDLPKDENGLTNPYEGISYDEYVQHVLPNLLSYENQVGMPDWFVPETYYYLWDGFMLVGEFRLRHQLTQALKNGSGHIGYSIKKEYRNRGYGSIGMKLMIELAKKIILEDEIYLRVLKSNTPSIRVIRKTGAYIASEDDTHYFFRIKKNAE